MQVPFALAIDYAFAFKDGHHAIYAGHFYFFQRAVRPLHFKLVYCDCVAQSEMKSRVALRSVASAAYHIRALAQFARRDVTDCSRCIARAMFCDISDQAHFQPVATWLRHVAQDCGLPVHIVDDHIEPPIAIQISDGEATATPYFGETAAGRCRDALEFAV